MKELIERYLGAKALEQTAKEYRLETETKLFSAFNFTDPEGTKTEITPPWKLSITNNLKRTVDMDKYNNCILVNMPAYNFIKFAPEIDMKILRLAEKAYPAIVVDCVTVKPQKPTIKIKEIL